MRSWLRSRRPKPKRLDLRAPRPDLRWHLLGGRLMAERTLQEVITKALVEKEDIPFDTAWDAAGRVVGLFEDHDQVLDDNEDSPFYDKYVDVFSIYLGA